MCGEWGNADVCLIVRAYIVSKKDYSLRSVSIRTHSQHENLEKHFKIDFEEEGWANVSTSAKVLATTHHSSDHPSEINQPLLLPVALYAYEPTQDLIWRMLQPNHKLRLTAEEVPSVSHQSVSQPASQACEL